jgi:hypothetical protein
LIVLVAQWNLGYRKSSILAIGAPNPRLVPERLARSSSAIPRLCENLEIIRVDHWLPAPAG